MSYKFIYIHLLVTKSRNIIRSMAKKKQCMNIYQGNIPHKCFNPHKVVASMFVITCLNRFCIHIVQNDANCYLQSTCIYNHQSVPSVAISDSTLHNELSVNSHEFLKILGEIIQKSNVLGCNWNISEVLAKLYNHRPECPPVHYWRTL